jgi:hypothetical protein
VFHRRHHRQHHAGRVRNRIDRDGDPGSRRGPRLAREPKIIGTPDSSISGRAVDTGAEAKVFAATIRKHTLDMTDGRTYAETVVAS